MRKRLAGLLGLGHTELEELFLGAEPDQLLPGAPRHAVGPADLLLPSPAPHAFGGRGVGRNQLDAVEVEITRIVDEYEYTGPAVMGPRALELQSRVSSWLGASLRQRERVDVCRYAAQLAGLLGYMAVNVGRFRLADAYCGQGLYLADEAGDLDLQLWMRGTQAHCAYYEGNWDLAVSIARAGHTMAPNNPQAIRLLVNGEARSQAKLGRADLAERAVGKAMDLLDRQQDAPSHLTPCIAFDSYGYPRLAGNAATAHVAAGDADRVLALTNDLDNEVESLDSVWSRALVGLDVAATLLAAQSPEVDEAMRLGQRAISVCSSRPIRSVWQRSVELKRLAEPWADHPSVLEYREAHRSWAQSEATMAVAP
jgi:tetratricopeptide (TPR) repeat protein